MSESLKEILLEAQAPDGARVVLGVTSAGRFAVLRQGDPIHCDGGKADARDGARGARVGEHIHDCVRTCLRVSGLIPRA